MTKVIDGDTVMLENGDIVRYLGIDAPPLKKSEGGPEFYAREAVRQNKSMVLLKKVRLEFDVEKKDHEGRLLAYVYVKNVFVNGELVRLGCARVVVTSTQREVSGPAAEVREGCVGEICGSVARGEAGIRLLLRREQADLRLPQAFMPPGQQDSREKQNHLQNARRSRSA